jgi:hypothetical protein
MLDELAEAFAALNRVNAEAHAFAASVLREGGGFVRGGGVDL